MDEGEGERTSDRRNRRSTSPWRSSARRAAGRRRHLPPHMSADLAVLITTLRQQATEGSALGLVSVEDDYFVLVRIAGDDVRLLLSGRDRRTGLGLGP